MSEEKRSTEQDAELKRAQRDEKLFATIVIVTLVAGIAAMSVDYVWNILKRDTVNASVAQGELEP